MHGKPLNLLVFVILMGPLIWLSQTMHWGDTGTFVCVVIGLVGGWFLLRGGKSVSKKIGHTFNRGKKGAAADFMFAPSDPVSRQAELLTYRHMAKSHVGQWNAPALMPHPQKMPVYEEARASRNRVQITQIPDPTAGSLQVPRYSPHEALQVENRRKAQAGGPPLSLGPGAQMYLTTSLTGAIIVDAQPRRLASPVFIEEWMRLGLGLLVVDVYGDYVGFLASKLSDGFGFLAGSYAWEDSLSTLQQSRYMPLEGTTEATSVGDGIASEGLQVVFNMTSYQNSTEAGTLLLALLAGIEHKAREIPSKPCAVLLTDARVLLPEHDEDRLIENMGVAQNVFDILMNLLENAGFPGLRNLAIFLSVPTLECMGDEVLVACRLWIVNSTNEKIIGDVSQYIDLKREEVEQLQDGDTLLLDAPKATASFIRLRRTTLQVKERLPLPSQVAPRQTEELETEQGDDDDPLGENPGLKEEA